MGSTSKMRLLKAEETREDPSCLEMYDLHGSDTKSFDVARFDYAMVGWLDCLRELGAYAKKQDKQFKPPYEVGGLR